MEQWQIRPVASAIEHVPENARTIPTNREQSSGVGSGSSEVA